MDYTQIIQELSDAGWSQKKIGDYVGLSQATICDYFKGHYKQMKFTPGTKLAELHKKVCGGKKAQGNRS